MSPYSTALALEVDSPSAIANFHVLSSEGAEGPWGYYDALDYTRERVPRGERRVVVSCYMAHHQGMTLVALSNCLRDRLMQRRFQRHPLARSIELLLQERMPAGVFEFQPASEDASDVGPLPAESSPVSRRIITPMTAVPRAHLLSNGQYSVMLTNSGAGYSNCRDLSLTRWRSDTTRDMWGQFIYVRELGSGRVWSAGYQPTKVSPDDYEVIYSLDKADIRRRDGDWETHLEVAVSPENNAEVRQLSIINHGRRPARFELTSYCEIVLSPSAADWAHPAFNKLFIETEYIAERNALLARRRPRDAEQKPLWAVHVLASQKPNQIVEHETDRAQFLGRGGDTSRPAAMAQGTPLSGTTGPVLDPIFSLRTCLDVAPDESASVTFVTAFADSREEALLLADQYHDPRFIQRTFELAWRTAKSSCDIYMFRPTIYSSISGWRRHCYFQTLQ